LPVAAKFIAVFVFDADFRAAARPIFIKVASVVHISVRAVPTSIPLLPVSVVIHIATAIRMPVASNLAMVSLRLIAASSLILLPGRSGQSGQELSAALQRELILPLGRMWDEGSTRRAR
jgi:hypothetical protein